jgi:hypothetical protein
MLNIRRWNPWMGGLLAVVSAALVGCTASKTNVSATGNVPAQYQHVYMSVQAIWFNTSATAGPDDTTWAKFPLTTPVTVDLAAAVDGTLQSITTGLGLGIGTYNQVRLIPVDATATLLTSAHTLGATYNSEVDYLDSAGTAHQVPMELQNPDKGIGVATSVQVKGQATNVLSPSSSSSSTTTPTTTNTPFSLAINIDGAKDLVPFTYGSATGMLLNPHVSAYDSSAVGAVTGTLNISGLTGLAVAGNTTFVNIQVTAESLSADGTRHVAVNSAPVHSDGTFTVYPLATTSASPTSYDMVIHGPGIQTIIVKSVAVNVAASSSTTPTPVSIGTLTPIAAISFAVNLTNTAALPAGTLALPAGARVGFYQTVPANGEVPYLIDEEPIDPFSRTFSSDEALASGAIQYGTFSSGSTVTLASSNPAEGASTYRVAATAPLFADGVLTTTVAAATKNLTIPTLSVASGATSNTPTLTISQTTPGTFNQGDLIISHDGAIVATAILDTILSTGATRSLAISGLPGGGGTSGTFAPALYYVSVRVWNSGNPAGTLKREIYPVALDLRNGSLTSYSLAIN